MQTQLLAADLVVDTAAAHLLHNGRSLLEVLAGLGIGSPQLVQTQLFTADFIVNATAAHLLHNGRGLLEVLISLGIGSPQLVQAQLFTADFIVNALTAHLADNGQSIFKFLAFLGAGSPQLVQAQHLAAYLIVNALTMHLVDDSQSFLKAAIGLGIRRPDAMQAQHFLVYSVLIEAFDILGLSQNRNSFGEVIFLNALICPSLVQTQRFSQTLRIVAVNAQQLAHLGDCIFIIASLLGAHRVGMEQREASLANLAIRRILLLERIEHLQDLRFIAGFLQSIYPLEEDLTALRGNFGSIAERFLQFGELGNRFAIFHVAYELVCPGHS